VSRPLDTAIIEILDREAFDQLPPCADPRFDHRSCDYWEDEVRGLKSARPSWWTAGPRPASPPPPLGLEDNPFAPRGDALREVNPFAPVPGEDAGFNPFRPPPLPKGAAVGADEPRKLRLLSRGRAVFGSYAKVLALEGRPAAYAQFGPLSAYPRAQRIRELYPRLPRAPLPAVITCVATTSVARGLGLGVRLIADVVGDLSARGFSAVEAYPDLTLGADEASAASPTFWQRCGFVIAMEDERYPVMRAEL
jgi:GNAT superfamily N-acetyltransferase